MQTLNRMDGHCVFLMPLGDEKTTRAQRLYGCAIHKQRPNTCRMFPLGRIMAFGGDGMGIQEEFVLSSRCAGFDAAGPEEPVFEGYTAPNAAQTVQGWMDKNLPAENRTETSLAFEVFKRFLDEGVHARTESQPRGKLDAEFVMSALLRLFYVPPSPPRDPSLDHAVIMGRLEVLRDEGPQLVLATHKKWQEVKGVK